MSVQLLCLFPLSNHTYAHTHRATKWLTMRPEAWRFSSIDTAHHRFSSFSLLSYSSLLPLTHSPFSFCFFLLTTSAFLYSVPCSLSSLISVRCPLFFFPLNPRIRIDPYFHSLEADEYTLVQDLMSNLWMFPKPLCPLWQTRVPHLERRWKPFVYKCVCVCMCLWP